MGARGLYTGLLFFNFVLYGLSTWLNFYLDGYQVVAYALMSFMSFVEVFTCGTIVTHAVFAVASLGGTVRLITYVLYDQEYGSLSNAFRSLRNFFKKNPQIET